jgi:hypothetical protein
MIARALADPAVRAAVRDAMRSSPLTEHKLTFHDFLRTSAGELLVREAARASDISTASLRTRMRRLPMLDFYVPVRAHRLGWHGTADYFVGASVAGDPPSTVFDPSGQEVVANLEKLASESAALFMLQSAERKGRRIKPQALVPGLTIQDPGDGQLSGTLTEVDASGRSVTTDLATLVPVQADLAALCTGKKCEPPPPPPTPKTRLNRLSIDNVCDNGFCLEGNEFEFRTFRTGISSTTRIEGVPSAGVLALAHFLISTTPTSGALTVAVKETDLSSPDDIWAVVTYSPVFVGDIRLTTADNAASWSMKQRPHVAVDDPYQLALRIDWPN